MLPNLSFVLGGAASGKSDFAETLLNDQGPGRRIYAATAQAFDDEMRVKIAAHRAARGDGWLTIETPLDLSPAFDAAGPGDAILLDCATLWLSNHMLNDADLEGKTDGLAALLAGAPCPVVVVSNEVGQGIVPDNALARRFRNAQGRLNRRLASAADLVVLITAGLPRVLKGRMPTGAA
ncbi:bifunctional adenosylcobinamide kinase/adenosylcobinamide-phosphate guanylyltransferase [Oceaniglobus indicus]|uniref:bifunctional adenosylcobinamide kinase/adenosylcobinamide-phosphate guanylyltransferase n=1 Tax=Oceaniglobus indicus TaxID=2047749 RepID=UPI000C176BF9|nr:bifunctional adenosylcobinamide kinase/adenosylcobinamide-phosphate guanylyltransferase [Oceaniglobus indicus]